MVQERERYFVSDLKELVEGLKHTEVISDQGEMRGSVESPEVRVWTMKQMITLSPPSFVT